jgi:geranylgeranyl reductase
MAATWCWPATPRAWSRRPRARASTTPWWAAAWPPRAAGEAAPGMIKDLKLARKLFMREHKNVFKILGAMQDAYYKSDERRERFVSLCHDVDVQRLTFEAYMNKELVKARPLAHLKIG